MQRKSLWFAAIAVALAVVASIVVAHRGRSDEPVVASGYVTGFPPGGWPNTAAVYLYPGVVPPGPFDAVAGAELDDGIDFEFRARRRELPADAHGYATATVIAWGIEDHVLSYDRFCTRKVIRVRLVERQGEEAWVGPSGKPVALSLHLPFDRAHERCR